jgi:GH43 family beta-xylosidase
MAARRFDPASVRVTLEVGNNHYFMFSSWSGGTQNVYLMAMTNPWTTTGNRVLLTRPEHAWEQEGSDSVNEGPEPLHHDGRIFVTYSASQCADPGYKLGLLELTGADPLNAASWTKSATPVFQTANGAYGPAHNGFFVSPDPTESWLVYHATTNPRGSCWTDRTTRIQRFEWNADGTPRFGEPLGLDTRIVVPSGE